MSDLMLPLEDDMMIDKNEISVVGAGDDRFEFMKGKPKPKPCFGASTSFALSCVKESAAVGIKF